MESENQDIFNVSWCRILHSTMVRYEEPKETTSDKDVKLDFIVNEKAMNELLSGLSEYEFIKVTHCKTTKKIWVKLENIDEGDKKGKDGQITSI